MKVNSETIADFLRDKINHLDSDAIDLYGKFNEAAILAYALVVPRVMRYIDTSLSSNLLADREAEECVRNRKR